MSSNPRIDELRKKFEENPRRYFAPLANEYRKAGDLEQAIGICREHLKDQPGHMSGHIVFGQALFEAHQLDEARTVFESALTLDPENLIALRHLGDIAREGGDGYQARQWYQRVLDFDPRNDEIAGLVRTLADAQPLVPEASAETASAPEEATLDAAGILTGDEVIAGAPAAADPAEYGQVRLDEAPPPLPTAPAGAEAATIEFAPPPLPVPPAAESEGETLPAFPRAERRPPNPALPDTIEIPQVNAEEVRRSAASARTGDFVAGVPALELADALPPRVPSAPVVPPAPPVAPVPAEHELLDIDMAEALQPPPAAEGPRTAEFADLPLEMVEDLSGASAESLLDIKGVPEPESPMPRLSQARDSRALDNPLAGLEEFRPGMAVDENPLGDLVARHSDADVTTDLSAFDVQVAHVPEPPLPPPPPPALAAPFEPEEFPPIPTPAAPMAAVPTPAAPLAAIPTPVAPLAAVPTPTAPVVSILTPALPLAAIPTPVVAEPAVAEPAAPFVTATMAQLLLAQGHAAQSAEMYRQLLAQQPGDPSLRAGLAAAEAALAPAPAPAGPTMRELLARLATWRPGTHAEAMSAPEPVAPAPDAVPVMHRTPIEAFAGVGVGETAVARVSSATESVALAASAVAATAVAEAPASAGGPAMAVAAGGLADLFGSDVPEADERAALALAGLFDEPAGGAMAEGAATDAPAPAPGSVPGAPTRPAEAEMSLATVFKTTPSGGAATPTPRSTSAFSFEQFFAPAKERATGANPALPAADADMAEFTNWLEGLKKK